MSLTNTKKQKKQKKEEKEENSLLLLGKGAEGCVFRPRIPCKPHSFIPSSVLNDFKESNTISKIFENKEKAKRENIFLKQH